MNDKAAAATLPSPRLPGAILPAMALRRSPLPVHRMTLWLAALILVLFNQALWREVARLTVVQNPAEWLFPLSLFTVLLLAMNAALTALAWPRLFKPLAVALILISAGASHFMNTFGIMIDRDMIRNVMQTDLREMRELLTPQLLLHLLLWGGLPAYLLSRQGIHYDPWPRATVRKALILLLSATLAGGLILSGYKHYAAFFRNHRHVRHLIAPVNVIYGTTSLLKRTWFNTPHQLRVVGADAHPGPLLQQSAKRTLLVLVVGETARAANFSLQGYPRETNPRLKTAGGVYFPHVSSCGTATAISLPCMFSAATRDDFSSEEAQYTEGLLDVMHHAGVRAVWLDNNSGCKGACDRVEHEDLSHETLPAVCQDGECFDKVLEHRLEQLLQAGEGPLVVVLHQKGSHGPAYYKRYPPQFRVFTPTCDRDEIDRCQQQAIINAYDNTLLYTDSVLADLIGLLARHGDRFNSAMLYVSDHGESLGENGIYLHGMPYALAPENQTHVPFYLWISPGFSQAMGLDPHCPARQRDNAYSHDNLFHTALGMMDVRTGVYRADSDMLAACRE